MESASANSSDTTASSPLERRRRILECGVGDCSSQYQIQEAEHYCLRHEKMDLLKKLKDDDENNNGSDEKDHDGHATKTKNSDAYYGPLPIILHHHPYQYHQSNITPADMAAEVQRRPDLPQQRLETTTTISGTWRTLDENETTLVEVRQQESSSIAASTAAFVQQEAEEEPQQRQQQEDDCCRPEEEEAAALPATSDNIHENSTFESCFSEEETTSPPPLVVFGSGGGVQKDNAVEKQQQQVELCCETLAMSSTTSTKNNTPVQQQQNMNGNISNIAVSIFRRSLTAELEQENMEPQQRLLAVPSCLEKCGNSSGSHQQRRNNKDINSSKSGNHGDRSGNSMCCYTRSNSDDEGVDSSSNGGAVNQQQRSRVVACAAAGATAVEENIRMQVYQICLYSIVGMTIRVYSERLFGLDCTTGTAAVQDVFTPFFSQICVTTNGFTNQTGGALFIDLPANMLGCFIIGLISNTSRPEHPIPWFDANHTLQKNASYLLGLRVGLCGCLTTFASWNTQMVAMLDGTGTVLGPQIGAALFGYVIGLCSAIGSFLFGQHSAEWFYTMHERNRKRRSNRQHLRRREQRQQQQDRQDREQRDVVPPTCTHDVEDQRARVQTVGEDHNTLGNSNSSRGKGHRRFKAFVFGAEGVLAPVLVSGLFAAFVVGDVVYQIPFYREMWLTALMSPLGALLRWQLKKFFNHQPWPCGCRNRSRRVVGSHHSGSGNSDNVAIAAATADAATTRRASSVGLGSSMRRVSQSVMNMPVAFVDWMPWGTFVANMLAVVASAAAKALLHLHYYDEAVHPWANNILWAIMTGFAGNLSTVSTFASEICAMKKTSQMHIYGFGSLCVAMVVGLAVYSPIARF